MRSSKEHFGKASGLRWVSLMWLTTISFAQRIWALPFLTVLAPSERYYQAQGRTPKKVTDWARQMVCQLRRWLPGWSLIVAGDSTYAALDFLHYCQSLHQPVTVITRLRLDAALYEPAPAYAGMGRPRLKGQRLPTPQQRLDDPNTHWTRLPVVWYDNTIRQIEISTHQAVWYHTGLPPVPIRFILIRDVAGKFAPQALLSTDVALDPLDILVFFKRRWQMEPTFRHVRQHLGVETQRQWSPLSIARTTPVLLGLFSFVTLLAHELFSRQPPLLRCSAWYIKAFPTFADALAAVRYALWNHFTFQMSSDDADVVKLPRVLLNRFLDLLCYAP